MLKTRVRIDRFNSLKTVNRESQTIHRVLNEDIFIQETSKIKFPNEIKPIHVMPDTNTQKISVRKFEKFNLF